MYEQVCIQKIKAFGKLGALLSLPIHLSCSCKPISCLFLVQEVSLLAVLVLVFFFSSSFWVRWMGGSMVFEEHMLFLFFTNVWPLASSVFLEPTPKTGLQKAGYNCCAQLSAGHFKLRKYYNYGYGSRRSWSDRQTPKGVIWVHGLLDETPTGDDVLLWSCWVTTYA